MLGEDDDTEETGGVSIDHVSGGDIYDALFEVLRQTNSILTWSFGGCVVANTAVIADLPEGLIDDVGSPLVVSSGSDILAAVEST
jgi:hypothetical protein